MQKPEGNGSIDDKQGVYLWAFAIVLASTAYFTFRGIVQHEFLTKWDDQMIYQNPHLKQLTWENVKWMFSDFSYHPRHIYMPLAWLWWTVVNHFLGSGPSVHHQISLWLHVGNSVLVLLLIRRLLLVFASGTLGMKTASCRALFIPGLAALFWALHPLRVEPVAWAITQKFLISTTLAMGVVFFWIEWLQRPGSLSRWWWYIAALTAFAASLMFYPLVLTLPGILLLLTLAYGGLDMAGPETWWVRLPAAGLAIVPFLMCSLLVILPALLHYDDRYVSPTGLAALTGSRWFFDFAEAAYVWMHFLWKPFTTGPFQPVDFILLDFDPTSSPFVFSMLAFVTLTAFSVLFWHRFPWLLVGWLCHLCLLVPMIGIAMSRNFPSDRYSYLQGICLSVVLAFGTARLGWSKWPPWIAKGAVLASLVLTLCVARMSAAQTAVWHDIVPFLEHVLRYKHADSNAAWGLQTRLAYHYFEREQWQEGADALRKAARYPEVDFETMARFVGTLDSLGDLKAAEVAAVRAAVLKPGFKQYMVVASQANKSGNINLETSALRYALRYRSSPRLFISLVQLLMKQGRYAEAVKACEEGMRIKSGSVQLAQLDRLAMECRQKLESPAR